MCVCSFDLLVVEEGNTRLEELIEIKGVVRQELHAARLAHKTPVDAAKLAREDVKVEGRGQPALRFLLEHERADAHLDNHTSDSAPPTGAKNALTDALRPTLRSA